MKSLICALIILCSVILSTVLVAVYTNKILSDFVDTIEVKIPNSCPEALSGVDDVVEEYKKLKPFLILFAHEKEVEEIEMYISDIKSAAKEDERAALTEAKSRLKLHIYQLRRLSVFSMESIF